MSRFLIMRKRKEFKLNSPVIVRSGLEKKVGDDLIDRKVGFSYEANTYQWREILPRAECTSCGEKGTSFLVRSYTPDFFLSNGVILEVKGRFTSKDRKIAAAMKDQHPELDIRMVFSKDNWLNRNHKNRYSDWCRSKGIKFVIGKVPEEWVL